MASTSRRRAGADLAPLIQGEDYPPYRDGLPAYVTLRNAAVPRRTNCAFKV